MWQQIQVQIFNYDGKLYNMAADPEILQQIWKHGQQIRKFNNKT